MKYGVTEVFIKNLYYSNLKNKDGSYKYKYIINVGSSRSSKTFSLIENCFKRCENEKNHKITIWRDTKESLKSTVWSDIRKIVNLSNRKINMRRDTYPIMVGSSVIEPHGADATNAHGLTQDTAWLNEPKLITEEVFNQIDQRCKQIWIDYNPYEVTWLEKITSLDTAIVIHSTYKNNPFCPIESKIKIDSYEPTPINIKNQTANEYMWQVYGLGLKAEKPNKIYHNWKKISLEKFHSLDYVSYYGIDWGMVAPTTMIECKYDGDGNLYVNELLYKSEIEMIDSLKIKFGDNWQSILKNKGLTAITSHLKDFSIDSGAIIICDTNKPDKIRDLRLSNYNAIPAYKPSVNSGISLIQRMNVYYTSTSKNLEKEYEQYEWEVFKGLNLEKPIKKNDHALDPIRYVVRFLETHLGITL